MALEEGKDLRDKRASNSVLALEDEKAIRAKRVAEDMFNAKDIDGALKYARQARSLCPTLDGIGGMVLTFGVHFSAQKRIKGEIDWYSVLRVHPMDDYDTMKKQYLKLTSMLHPANNKSIGIDGALDLVMQAWSVLSDQGKRRAYDERINAVASTDYVDVDPPTSNADIHNKTDPEHASKTLLNDTFWTICHQCKTHFQYLRAYVNHRLLCQSCNKPFFAMEIDVPPKDMHTFITPPRRFRRFSMNRPMNRQVVGQKLLADSNLNGSPLQTNQAAPPAVVQAATPAAQAAPPAVVQAATPAAQAAPPAIVQAARVAMMKHIFAKLKRRREEEEQKCEEALHEDDHVSKKGQFNPARVGNALTLSSFIENLQRSPDGTVGASRMEYCSVNRVDDNFLARGSYRAELKKLRVELDVEEISQKLEKLNQDTDDMNEEPEKEYLKTEDTCYQNNVEKSEDSKSASQATTMPFAGNDTADMVTEDLGKMSIDVNDVAKLDSDM